jgi:hypothetical protein
MKECLECKKEFDAKREAAKFCSVNCRVKWNRKQPKKNIVTPLQMQVLYNSVLEMVGKINYGVAPTLLDGSKVNHAKLDEVGQWQEAKPTIKRRTPEEWVLWKREILDADEFQEWVKELESADYLTSKQKSLIKNT